MGTTDLTTNFDLVSATQPVIMSDQRDFERPHDWPLGSTTPLDSNLADDENPFIKSVQQFMKNNPLGPSYAGPLDGKMNSELKSLLQRFELALQAKTGQSIIGTIISGGNVKPQGFGNALKLLKSKLPEEKEETNPPQEIKKIKEIKEIKEIKDFSAPSKDSSIIKSFQSFLSSSHPIIGSPYQGPIDGAINPDLISAAKEVESIIAKNINDSAVNGVLWNDKTKTFNTTTQDLEQAINLIKQQASKKSSFNNKNLRKFAFSMILKKINIK